MRHLVPHPLDPSEARRLAERAFEHYRERYARFEPRLRWLSETVAEASFRAASFELRGRVELLPDAIAFELEVPALLRVFRGRAESIVEREVRRWCDEARGQGG